VAQERAIRPVCWRTAGMPALAPNAGAVALGWMAQLGCSTFGFPIGDPARGHCIVLGIPNYDFDAALFRHSDYFQRSKNWMFDGDDKIAALQF
jgi:hypothetical protein